MALSTPSISRNNILMKTNSRRLQVPFRRYKSSCILPSQQYFGEMSPYNWTGPLKDRRTNHRLLTIYIHSTENQVELASGSAKLLEDPLRVQCSIYTHQGRNQSYHTIDFDCIRRMTWNNSKMRNMDCWKKRRPCHLSSSMALSKPS